MCQYCVHVPTAVFKSHMMVYLIYVINVSVMCYQILTYLTWPGTLVNINLLVIFCYANTAADGFMFSTINIYYFPFMVHTPFCREFNDHWFSCLCQVPLRNVDQIVVPHCWKFLVGVRTWLAAVAITFATIVDPFNSLVFMFTWSTQKLKIFIV